MIFFLYRHEQVFCTIKHYYLYRHEQVFCTIKHFFLYRHEQVFSTIKHFFMYRHEQVFCTIKQFFPILINRNQVEHSSNLLKRGMFLFTVLIIKTNVHLTCVSIVNLCM